MFNLASKILRIMSKVLDLPSDFFEPFLTAPVATLRLIHYWPIHDFSKGIGVGEHTDYGLLTILKQDAVGGLQVFSAKDYQWVHCCPIPNAFVVNIGDMLARWTAHRFKSTIHRVVNTTSSDRFSVPFFLEPNLDTKISIGGICSGPVLPDRQPGNSELSSSALSKVEVESAESILEKFYRGSGQLRNLDELTSTVTS